MRLTQHYSPANPVLWQGRPDSEPFACFFQQVSCFDLTHQSLEKLPPSTILIGFCCDIGVTRNLGRAGAKLGPDAIRAQLSKLACPYKLPLIDIGNIIPIDEDLESAQQALGDLVSYCHQTGHKTVVLGGGHEVAWGHFSGLTPQYNKLGIINIDAHFDLRQMPAPNYGTSGTPFNQIADFCETHSRPFNYCCLGIQPLSNTINLFERAKSLNVSYLSAEQMYDQNKAWQIAFLDDFLINQSKIYLTICLDAFAESYAPGVSAPSPLGITPAQALPLLKYIQQTGKVVAIDIAELSPPWDAEQKTARLAAQLIGSII